MDVALLCAAALSYAKRSFGCGSIGELSFVPRAYGLGTESLSKLRLIAFALEVLEVGFGSDDLLVGRAMRDCKLVISAVLGRNVVVARAYIPGRC